MDSWRRLSLGLLALGGVLVVGTAGYLVLGFSPLEAAHQTVTTITTVGFREVRPLEGAGQVFTIVLILTGVGTALYNLTLLIETIIEGQLHAHLGRRKMERQIRRLSGHVMVCGYGRVGREIADYPAGAGQDVVVIERDPERVVGCPHLVVAGDATDDGVLDEAGIDRARVLVTALATDADNLYVTLSGRSLRPDLFIVARARMEASEGKLTQAGADRWSTPRASGASASPPSCSSPTWPSSSTWSCTTAVSSSAWPRSPCPPTPPWPDAPGVHRHPVPANWRASGRPHRPQERRFAEAPGSSPY